MNKTEVLQVRVSPAEKEMPQALADKEHLTIAEMVRYLIRKEYKDKNHDEFRIFT